MQVDLDTHELYYLLDACLRGSHLRSSTVERFVDQWYYGLTEHQRMSLFEWAVRLSYTWSDKDGFVPQSAACGKDVIFMKRYHPGNQYEVTTVYKRKKEKHRAFLMDGEYYVSSSRRIDPQYIKEVKHLEFPEWEGYKQPNVDYDKNIIL